MNIILIGMPACGKSTVGVLLAKTLGLAFIDTDLLIQSRCGSTLQNIINSRGISGFLYEEERTLLSLEASGSVISTGGSAVYSERAMERLSEGSIVVYIRLSCREIERRLTNIRTRGVAIRPGESISQLYDERTPLYERYATVTVDAEGLDAEELVGEICEKLANL